VNYRVGEGDIVCSSAATPRQVDDDEDDPRHRAADRGTVTYAGQTMNDLPTAERVRRGIAPYRRRGVSSRA